MELIAGELQSLEVEKKLREILYFKEFEKGSLEWGMNYITFSPSKRIRPLLVLESYRIFSDNRELPGNDAYILAAIIELIHTYSLVHDDLPCMDDDELRRGVKTLHVIKSEAFAVLVGDALLTRAFSLFSSYSKLEKLPLLLEQFSRYSGRNGMLRGQLLDLEGENNKLSIDDIQLINYHKTASLITLSLFAGAVDCNAEKNFVEILEKLGTLIGYIFQLQDDILDIVGHTHVIGKTVGSDLDKRKASIPLSKGLDFAKKMLFDYQKEALDLVSALPGNRDFFMKFINFLTTREK